MLDEPTSCESSQDVGSCNALHSIDTNDRVVIGRVLQANRLIDVGRTRIILPRHVLRTNMTSVRVYDTDANYQTNVTGGADTEVYTLRLVLLESQLVAFL